MDKYDAYEQSHINGYEKGFVDGKKEGVKEAIEVFATLIFETYTIQEKYLRDVKKKLTDALRHNDQRKMHSDTFPHLSPKSIEILCENDLEKWFTDVISSFSNLQHDIFTEQTRFCLKVKDEIKNIDRSSKHIQMKYQDDLSKKEEQSWMN